MCRAHGSKTCCKKCNRLLGIKYFPQADALCAAAKKKGRYAKAGDCGKVESCITSEPAFEICWTCRTIISDRARYSEPSRSHTIDTRLDGFVQPLTSYIGNGHLSASGPDFHVAPVPYNNSRSYRISSPETQLQDGWETSYAITSSPIRPSSPEAAFHPISSPGYRPRPPEYSSPSKGLGPGIPGVPSDDTILYDLLRMAQDSVKTPDYEAMDDASAKAAAVEHSAKLAKLKLASEAIRRALVFSARLGEPPAEILTGKGKPANPRTPSPAPSSSKNTPAPQSPLKKASGGRSPLGDSGDSVVPSVASPTQASPPADPPAPAPAPRAQKRKRTGDSGKAKTHAPGVRRSSRKTVNPDDSD
ncbi:hypothetical protein CC79DRAFT_1322037 [Sarocladium strictum]